MASSGKHFFQGVARLVLLLVVGSLATGWTIFRSWELSLTDFLWFFVGVAGFLWILIWMKTKKAVKQTLIVPYAPIFVVPLIAGIANYIKIFSNLDFLNLIIFFYCGFMTAFVLFGHLTYRRKN